MGAQIFLAIGATRIECGLHIDGCWRDLPFVVSLEPNAPNEPGIAPLVRSLPRIAEFLKTELQAIPEQADRLLIRVVVADIWLSSRTLPWSEADMSTRETAHAFAMAQFVLAGVEAAPGDVVRIDDRPFGEPRFAVLYPALLLTAINSLADDIGATVTSVLPLSDVAWDIARTHLPDAEALGVIDAGMLLVVRGRSEMADVVVRRWDASSSAGTAAEDQLQLNWRRIKLRNPEMDSSATLPVLDLTLDENAEPTADDVLLNPLRALQHSIAGKGGSPRLRLLEESQLRRHRHDAVSVRKRMTWVQAVVATVGVLAILMLAWQVSAAALRIRALSEKMHTLDSSKCESKSGEQWSRDDLRRIKAVNAAIRQMNIPIAELLGTLQPPSGIDVAVLNVDVSGYGEQDVDADGRVKITAEARTGAGMAWYVGYLAERKHFSDVYLIHHEIAERQPDQPYRFSLEAKWLD